MPRLLACSLALLSAVSPHTQAAPPAAPPTQRIALPSLCEPAREAAIAAAGTLPQGARLDVRCEAGHAAVELPAGRLQVHADRIDRPLDGLHDVTLELRVDDRLQRRVRMPVRVTLEAPQWCAQEALAVGQPTAPRQFAPCLRPLRHTSQWTLAGQALPAGRLKRALRPGELLMARDVADGDLRLRGDAVTVVLRAGSITLESPGRLSQDARVGDTVSVSVQGSAQPVSGRLAAAQLVEVESLQ